MLWDGLSIGSAGIISGSTNVFAKGVQTAKSAAEGPERDAAMDVVKAARAIAGKYPLMAAMKQIEAWRSGDDRWTRMTPPLVSLSADQKTSLRADLESIGQMPSAG